MKTNQLNIMDKKPLKTSLGNKTYQSHYFAELG
jgi:hypothetical protein